MQALRREDSRDASGVGGSLMERYDYVERIADLCSRFGYPAPIRDALESTCRQLQPLNPQAILLVGSAARGELSFRPGEDGKLEMFSDIEIFCLLRPGSRGPVAEVRERIRRLEGELFAVNGLFHLDCLITHEVPQGADGRGLLWFEGGRTFKVLQGPEEPYFGRVEPSGISLELVNQLVIIRLWWLLVHFPSWLLRGERARKALTGGARDAFVYTQVRNLLDVLSIWLPNEGVFECGYGARLEYVRQHAGELRGLDYLPEDFMRDAAEATRRKLECDLDADPAHLYERVIAAYEGLLYFLLAVPRGARIGALVNAVRERWAQRCRAPRSWKFRMYATALVARCALRKDAGLRWLRKRGDVEAAALEFLLEMHKAAVRRLEGRAEAAERHLGAAGDALWRFSGHRVSVPPELDDLAFAQAWHDLRSGFLRPFMRYFRKVRGQSAAIHKRITTDQERLTQWTAS